jgi:hypothetical protein
MTKSYYRGSPIPVTLDGALRLPAASAREDPLVTIKAGAAGGHLRRPPSAGSGTIAY